MLIAERQSLLQELIASRGVVDLETLASELRVSHSTVRRDVDLLVRQGIVTRTHGGVVWAGEKREDWSTSPDALDQRMGLQVQAKLRIARAARTLVHPGETVLLDGGSTTHYLARQLAGQALQIVTNSLPIANLFGYDEKAELFVVGGLWNPRYGVFLGPTAEHALELIHAKTLFFSVAGIYDGSLYNQNVLLVQAERRMMQQAQRVVLLADSTKFGQQALSRLCDLEQIDIVVTDCPLPEEFERSLHEAGCQIIVGED
jgi:DeoR/GlpR family transcriptional regulator of sugar metabolism